MENRFLIMVNQPIFAWILNPERGDHLLSEISLRSMRIVRECNKVHYDACDDVCGYLDDDWGIALVHL